MKLYGIIGYPLGHSFSQKYFTQKFLEQNITDCKYEVFSIPNINELANILKQHPNLVGLNITIPHKQSVYTLLNDSRNIPQDIHACNCIKIIGGQLIGYNTDIIGFEQSLLPQLKNHHNQALILGNGGAAVAVKFVLKKLNIPFKIVGRKIQNEVDLLYENVDEKIVKENLLIINTTPLGTFPNVTECANIPYQYLISQHYLFDLVYNPTQTLFLQKGQENGATIKNGYDMLVIQAEEAWKIWNEK